MREIADGLCVLALPHACMFAYMHTHACIRIRVHVHACNKRTRLTRARIHAAFVHKCICLCMYARV